MEKEFDFWSSLLVIHIRRNIPFRERCGAFKRNAEGIDILPEYLAEYISDGMRILDLGSDPATVLGGIYK